jgi:thioredoxin reductase (NADPH)
MPLPTRTKVAIIGSGPAGYTAAIYAGRANLEPVLFEGGGAAIEPITLPGGQLMITTEVENYPGFPAGVQGPELMELFKAQAERFGTTTVTADVTSVEVGDRPFRVVSTEGELVADTLIIATGASAKWLGIPSEQKFQNRGVSACATCDGALFKGRELAVIGGGDTAMEEATFLTRFAPKVMVIHRREEFRASRIMLDRARRNPKIDLVTNTVVDEILGALPKPGVTGMRLRDTRDGSTRDVPIGGVFIAIGHEPNSKLFRGVLDMDAAGYIKVQPGSTATKIPGVFACGDVADHVYRQAVTAAGTGCMAAIDAERFLGQ